MLNLQNGSMTKCRTSLMFNDTWCQQLEASPCLFCVPPYENPYMQIMADCISLEPALEKEYGCSSEHISK